MRASAICALTAVSIAFAFAGHADMAGVLAAASAIPSVAIVALPDGAIQPQAVVDAKDVLHVVYFSGPPASGNLYYARLAADGHRLTEPVRVNSIDGSALATGSVRGAQVSLGRNGFVHVAWHGAKPIAGSDTETVPMWYTRSNDGAHFEPQRAVSGTSKNLDGGSVAADAAGHVAVVWHAMGSVPGEGHRTVYIAKSSDDGGSFSAEAPATPAPVGACGCCGMRALFDRRGTLHVLYRAATNETNRDTTWLMIRGALPLTPVRVHPWQLQSCPMSTYALTESGDGLVAAWETAQQIYSASLDSTSATVGPVVPVPGSGVRKHPSVAVNRSGERLLAWTEGTAWSRGGTAAWRLTDRNGQQLASSQDAGPVPVWGLVSAVTLRDGSFILLR